MVAGSRSKESPSPLMSTYSSSRSGLSPSTSMLERGLRCWPKVTYGAALKRIATCWRRPSSALPVRSTKGTPCQRGSVDVEGHRREGLGAAGGVDARRGRRSRAPGRSPRCRRCSGRGSSGWRSRRGWACAPPSAPRPCGRAGPARRGCAGAPWPPAPSPAAGGSGSCRAARRRCRSSRRGPRGPGPRPTRSPPARRGGGSTAARTRGWRSAGRGCSAPSASRGSGRCGGWPRSGAALASRALSSWADLRSWPKGFSMTMALSSGRPAWPIAVIAAANTGGGSAR